MRILTFSILVLIFNSSSSAQIYEDYLGNGHTIGVKVTSSSDQPPDSSFHTVIGSNITPDMIGAARFLSNATVGVSYEDIEEVSQLGINEWIDQQMAFPVESYLAKYKEIYHDVLEERNNVLPSGAEIDSNRRQEFLGFAFYERLFTEDDVLRQRVAFALSQIFVITRNIGAFNNRGFGISSYYDVLYKGAFSNYRDLLEEISLHPVMGVYLSHFKNEKANEIEGTFPDENYAREIMQLFSIGLHELNIDGTIKLDQEGKSIPTYDIIDVQELAKVFTGLSGGAYDSSSSAFENNLPLVFWRSVNQYDLTVPMAMYEDYHEPDIKVLINGDTIPAGQPGMDDINQALDVLFNHDNAGPFIARRLIQHLVKSNPSPAYIKRIALVFNDNGKGERGDLGEVIRAILLDPEAIECNWLEESAGGKLIQPLERFLNFYLAFDIATPSGKYYFRDIAALQENVEQAFLNSPTVFNFFSPFYAEQNHVAPKSLVSPEFEILHSTSSINYINLMENAIKRRPFSNFTAIDSTMGNLIVDPNDAPSLDLTDEINIYDTQGIDALMDRLDLVLCRGQLSQETKDIIAYTIQEYQSQVPGYESLDAVQDALYFTLASPQYIIQK